MKIGKAKFQAFNGKIPFGKHQGKTLKEVPLKYIAWLLTEYEGNKIPKEAIEREALDRGCECRDGVWGIERRTRSISADFIDFLFPDEIDYFDSDPYDEYYG